MKREKLLEELPEHPAAARRDPHVLSVRGLVRRPLALSSVELAGLPSTAVTEDFTCEEGWRVPDQAWAGVSVGSLLDAAGAIEEGRWVEFAAADFRFSVPVQDARKAIVAIGLNGEPLSHQHGGPARLLLPGGACFTSVKWLDCIEVRLDEGPNRAAEIARGRIAGR